MWEALVIIFFIAVVAIHSVFEREKEETEKRAKTEKEASDRRIRELELEVEKGRQASVLAGKNIKISTTQDQHHLTKNQLFISIVVFLILALVIVFIMKALSSN